MDVDSNNCQICYTDFPKVFSTRRKPVICPCGFKYCKNCIKRCLLMRNDLPYCESCKNAFTMPFLINNLGSTWMTKTYREHRKNVLFEREKAQFPETMEYALTERKRRKFSAATESLREKRLTIRKQIVPLDKKIRDLHNRLNATKNYNQELISKRSYLFQIYQRLWSYWAPLDQTEMNALTVEISQQNLLKQPLDDQLRILDKQISEIRTKIYGVQNQTSSSASNSKTKFTQKCPVSTCSGFLSKQWICQLCKTKTCNKCLEIKNEFHICDPNNVETAKLIKQETKNCPGCGMAIHRISGCNQMWCTNCHIAFDYKTGRKVDGNIHNPHFYQWKRQNGQLPLHNRHREHVCGQSIEAVLPLSKISPNLRKKVSELIRITLHFQDTVLNRARNETGRNGDNRYLRIQFMLKDRTEARIKTTLITRDNTRNQKGEFIYVYEFMCTVMMESIYSIKNDYSDTNVEKVLEDVRNAKVFSNQQLEKICKAYKRKPQEITEKWKIQYIGQKIDQKN